MNEENVGSQIAGQDRQSSGIKQGSLNTIVLCTLLLVAVVTLYIGVKDNQFIVLDDSIYVTENKHVQNGLSLDEITWAFHLIKPGDTTYWHPLTWISLMIDSQLFGLDPGMFHLSNVIYHALNTILLFIVLWLYTRSRWRSLFVAALFAVHPVNVDTVAWVAERKNLLSTLFWMLTMLTYYFYAVRPNLSRYLLVFTIFVLGLLSKPMLVTLPFVLLLLDWWPLNRLKYGGESFLEILKSMFCRENIRPVVEKLPLIVLSLAMIAYNSSIMPYIGAFVSPETVPFDLRFKNAIISYSLYLRKLFWPASLTIFYPFPKYVPIEGVIGSLALVATITIIAFRYMKSLKYLFIGWLWFAGTLIPVSGIMQGGLWPQIAERWAYIPYIGIFIMISWGAYDLLGKIPKKEIILGLAASLLIISLSAKTWQQTGVWKDDYNLFGHAISVNNNDPIGHNNFGVALAKQKKIDQAILHFEQTLRLSPTMYKAYVNLANAYVLMKKPQQAIENYEKALRLNPIDAHLRFIYGNYLITLRKNDEGFKQLFEALKLDPYNSKAQYHVGMVLLENNEYEKASKHFEQLLKMEPENIKVRYTLASVYFNMHELEKAIRNYNEVLKTNPNYAAAHCGLGTIYSQAKRNEEAVNHFIEALRIDPKNVDAHCGLGSVYMVVGRTAESENEFKEAIKLNPKNIAAHSGLGLLLAKKGKYDEALKVFGEALKIDPKSAVVYFELATVYAAMGKNDEAEHNYQESLKIDPGYEFSLLNLGHLMLSKGYYDEAIRLYMELIKKNPHQPEVYNNLGSAYFNKSNVRKATEYYQLALKEKPDYAQAAQNLKVAQENLKKFEELEKKLQGAIQANPKNIMLYSKLGEVYRLMGEYDKAAAQYRKVLSVQPRDLQALNGLILVYSAGLGDYAKAVDVLQNMRQLQPGNPEIYYNIACIYAKQNKDEESIFWLRQAIEKGFKNWELLRKDPDLANVRDTAFVKGLMAKK